MDERPGVTRDRRETTADWRGKAFQLVDTGGIDDSDPTPIGRQVVIQAATAIDEADLILFVIDAHSGAAAGDLDVAERLRRSKKPVLVIANKCDHEGHEVEAQALWALGLGDVIPISAQHGRGAGDLLDAIVDRLPDAPEVDLDASAPRADNTTSLESGPRMASRPLESTRRCSKGVPASGATFSSEKNADTCAPRGASSSCTESQ